MTAVPKKKLTAAEYLEIERAAEFKSEFYNGEMYPMQGPGGPLGMAGARFDHNRVKDNLVQEFGSRLKGGPCRTLSSAMKVKVDRTGLYTYPDVVIYCGTPELEDDRRDTLLNPRVIFEVLSPSTEKYDRGTKFRHYQQIPSLAEYVLVSPDEAVCEHFVRQPTGSWLLTTVTGLDGELALATVEARVPLAEIYSGATLTEQPLR
ncbi:MAG: Uma2 family endonuclease [Gemmataceae bacterium]|nr:Uma2 family endonuclease [Gemmataceae bacterium]